MSSALSTACARRMSSRRSPAGSRPRSRRMRRSRSPPRSAWCGRPRECRSPPPSSAPRSSLRPRTSARMPRRGRAPSARAVPRGGLVHDAIVVGGGIAGLAAAWALRERDVVVLEAQASVGGRIRSERRGELWLNLGAHVFAGAGSATDALLQQTGVAAVEVPGILTAVSLRGRLVAGRRVETYPLALPLARRDRIALARTGLRLRHAVRRYGRVPAARVLAHLGDESFGDWLGPVPDAVDAILRATLRRSSAEPEQLAAGYGIGYFHLVWDRSGGLARNILGGPATLTGTIAAALGPRVRTASPVEAVI